MAQQPRPGQLGLASPPRAIQPGLPTRGGIPPALVSSPKQDEPKPEAMADLLRQHGALDDLPHLDQIGVRRTAVGVSGVVFTKGNQDWSQFTLLDLLGLQFGFLASSPGEGVGDNYVASAYFKNNQALPFPDVAHLHISRPTPDLKRWQDQVVDLSPVLEAGDCAKDVRLSWGDVVEIPEADHPLNAAWPGFSKEELANLKKCLTRQVEIVIKGKATKVTLAPQITNLGDTNELTAADALGVRGFHGDPTEPVIAAHAPFWLRPVLLQSKLVLISSDLSKVKVIRRDPATGQTREWVVDCSKGGDAAPNLWLLDGDRIEVPEKS